MPKTEYTNLYDITQAQFDIMIFVDHWAREKKTPVPQKEIVSDAEARGVGLPTILHSLKGLLIKGYLRRAIIISNKSYYVQLRRV
jgi:hypothetical protein